MFRICAVHLRKCVNISPRRYFAQLSYISVVLLRRLISSLRESRYRPPRVLVRFCSHTVCMPHGCRFRRKFRFVACFRLSVEIQQWCVTRYKTFRSLLPTLSLFFSFSLFRSYIQIRDYHRKKKNNLRNNFVMVTSLSWYSNFQWLI